MGNGYMSITHIIGFKFGFVNQRQYDSAIHILDTHCSETTPIDDYWKNRLLKILTNGKMIWPQLI